MNMKTKYGELRDYSYEDMLFGLDVETKVDSLDQNQKTLLPWCPLFGELPLDNLPEGYQVSRAIDTIHNARLLWGIDFHVYTPGLDEIISNDSWAESEELQIFYPKEKLLLARNLFIEWERIKGQTVKYRKRPYRYEEVHTSHGGTVRIPTYISDDLSQTPGDAIIHWFKKLPLDVRFKKLEEWQIFSILSIHEARKVVNISLYSGFFPCYYIKAKENFVKEFEKDHEIMKRNQIASDLLNRATSRDYLLGVKRRKDQRKFAKIGQEERKRGIKKKHEEWLIAARKIWKRNKEWPISDIAREVIKKLDLPEKKFQSIHKYLLKERDNLSM